MYHKGIQVAVGLKRCSEKSVGSQTTSEKVYKVETATQCGTWAEGSYGRTGEHKKWEYDDLVHRMHDKEMMIEWLIAEGLIAKERMCPVCGWKMSLVKTNDRSEG